MATLAVAVSGPTVPEPDVVLRGHANDVQAVCFHPNEKVLYTGCDEKQAKKIWMSMVALECELELAKADTL